jgi:hypothetical protein
MVEKRSVLFVYLRMPAGDSEENRASSAPFNPLGQGKKPS